MLLIITIIKKEVGNSIETEIDFRNGSKYLHTITLNCDANVPRCLNEINSFINKNTDLHDAELSIRTEFEYAD